MTCTTVDGTCEMLLGRWVRAPGGEAGGTDRNRLVLGDMSGCYVLFIILANLWKGEELLLQQTSDEGYRPKSLKAVVSIGISLIRQSPTCALQVKTPTEQYQVDGDGGEAAGTDTNELELGLGQEVMFYHYGEFKRGLAHVWIRHCFSQIVPPPLDMAYTCHCSFHLLIISWDCLCHYPPPFRYLC